MSLVHHIYAYRVEDGDWLRVSSQWYPEPRWFHYIAQDAAENYHSHHGGNEDSWPLVFEIAIRCHSYRVEIEIEYLPSFLVTKLARHKQDTVAVRNA